MSEMNLDETVRAAKDAVDSVAAFARQKETENAELKRQLGAATENNRTLKKKKKTLEDDKEALEKEKEALEKEKESWESLSNHKGFEGIVLMKAIVDQQKEKWGSGDNKEEWEKGRQGLSEYQVSAKVLYAYDNSPVGLSATMKPKTFPDDLGVLLQEWKNGEPINAKDHSLIVRIRTKQAEEEEEEDSSKEAEEEEDSSKEAEEEEDSSKEAVEGHNVENGFQIPDSRLSAPHGLVFLLKTDDGEIEFWWKDLNSSYGAMAMQPDGGYYICGQGGRFQVEDGTLVLAGCCIIQFRVGKRNMPLRTAK